MITQNITLPSEEGFLLFVAKLRIVVMFEAVKVVVVVVVLVVVVQCNGD